MKPLPHPLLLQLIRAGLAIGLILGLSVVSSDAQPSGALEWHDMEEALAIADSTGRPIFVDVWAPWCGWCRKMKKEVYPTLRRELDQHFILTRLNRDDNRSQVTYQERRMSPMKLAQQLETTAVPAIVILNPSGDYMLHVSGFMEKSKLELLLRYISSGAYGRESFESFTNGR